MKKIIFIFFIVINSVFANTSIDSLLENYQDSSEESLKTVDENLGHVFIYSQKDIKLMQYTKLSDILKELPLLNYNQNRYGVPSISLPGSKTTVGGFVRFFINDHEISSVHTQSPFLSWGDLPLDIVDYIEVYYGESSFSLGNDTGIYFIRIYTKKAYKENGNTLQTDFSKRGSNEQSLIHSQVFENGWSYLAYVKNSNIYDSDTYKNQTLQNNAKRRYLYFDINNDTTNINIGYADVKKDNFMGLSLDVVPNDGEIVSKDLFIDISKKFLADESLKASVSFDINEREYSEKNDQGIGLVPVIDLTKMGQTLPKEFKENLKFTKLQAHLSKTYEYENNSLLFGFNFSNKKYKVKNRKTVNFLNQEIDQGKFHDFDQERVYSLLFQDKYNFNDNMTFITNAKIDRYQRSGYLEDTTEELYRVGLIYTPFENFGLKTFYTKTYLPPSFYNIDFVDKKDIYLDSQKYKIFSIEGVFTTEKSKSRLKYNDVKIEDFVYLTPVGFVNIDHTIKTKGLIFLYEYLFSNNKKLEFNYYTTKLSETLNNSNKGGYLKYMSKSGKFEYFTSLIYKNSYRYLDVRVPSSFDLSFGVTYNYTKDLSFSAKAMNVLDKSTQSLYKDGFPGSDFAFEDYGRAFNISMKWVF
ncbi:TonB-dependent receptor [Malaciobacter mytili LMG 24559]|uniref:TonB-dependent receptor n=1 Tax=Malaciobacter mytili LMG 24559 TaxID=1032238 RepID=A0AAX2AI07_9BACT|nr:TonB-dependent receptor plug domain-containing protein [Malaciobacter mytili]AXH15385.1 putative TonB-dependent cobalamin receptor [Malaciobacter mytili LMG 24559]RXK15831.1 TonB-dependent receptor [Malaciobacter mytili LMG 24559]